MEEYSLKLAIISIVLLVFNMYLHFQVIKIKSFCNMVAKELQAASILMEILLNERKEAVDKEKENNDKII